MWLALFLGSLQHCFLLGRPFHNDHLLGDDCCHVRPCLVVHSNHSAPGYFVAPTVVPTCSSTE